MNLPKTESPKLNLSRKPGPPLMVDMERFFEFSFWMAEELLDLVAEHRPHFQLHQNQSIQGDIRLQKSDRFGS